MIIDTHHHIIPKSVVERIRSGDSRFQADIQMRGQTEWIIHKQGYAYPLSKKFYDKEVKLQDMNQANIDSLVLSPAPPMFYYWLDPANAQEISRLVNDGIAEFTEGNEKYFQTMATVPMQSPDIAIKEMERVHSQYNTQFVEIGTSIEGVNLDDPKLTGFFEAAESLGITLFLHPYYVGDKSGMSNYYFTNLIGNPLDTAIGAASLIFGGVLDKFPRLNVMLAHGGGYLPYQIGRLDKGYKERKESQTCKEVPSYYLKNFYFDTLTFNEKALEYLIEFVGSDRVLLGSDYPFDMGTLDPVEILNHIELSDEARRNIEGENIQHLIASKQSNVVKGR